MPPPFLYAVSMPSIQSVSELTAEIKKLLEQGFSRVEVIGEVSRLTSHASGHLYFTIKDKHAAISAVVWKSAAARLKTLPAEGQEFVFSGHISVYEPRGTYQLIVSKIEPVGAGQLAAEFERRKKEFAERGWFDTTRKRSIPELPSHIGIVTSPTAAAFEDVKKVLATRPGWLHITLAPAIVQGNAAPVSIKEAIQRLNGMDEHPDVILLVRGGGSMEDLWCFNDEVVVQAVVESELPVITGVGHEIDVTLADFAADARAATPSNAAELACPDRETLKKRLPRLPLLERLTRQRLDQAAHTTTMQQQKMHHAWQRQQDERRMHSLRKGESLYSSLSHAIATHRETTNRFGLKLARMEPNARLRQQKNGLHQLAHRLHSNSTQVLHRREQTLGLLQQKLPALAEKFIERTGNRLGTLRAQLHALGHHQVLARGYAYATDANGLVSGIVGLAPDESLSVHFHDGTVDTRIEALHPKENP